MGYAVAPFQIPKYAILKYGLLGGGFNIMNLVLQNWLPLVLLNILIVITF